MPGESVPTDEVVARLRVALAGFGGDAEDRDTALLWLLTAELLGQPRFGIGMLRAELERLQASTDRTGTAAFAAVGAVANLDALGLPGIVALAEASRRAGEMVDAHGAAVIGLRNVGATGILGCVARSLAEQGLIALVLAESAPMVAPWGGTAAAIGTNPIAFAAPRAGDVPLVVDFATAPMTLAALRGHRETGEPLAEGVGIDADGALTTDASALAAFLPATKMSSLVGLLVQMLAGVATGSTSGTAGGGPHALRGVTVIAFRPPSDEAAQGSVDLLQRWEAAGGHVPGRLDLLPSRLADLPATLTIDERMLPALPGDAASA
ncbi:hypothetical protein ASD65_00170 [Microbacterium sp. Root61]|uniref:Ldh family oxidoreductase n=1 Tax=Microbacterium sp. Root61 TaxID=1736570 RepID=UPI0006FA3992|nr:Ldh family oxidoreductase [Microbacterium sp. Root61]KRA23009.1 hypothetical protein ASD65_00170 [Microbacterium sp. Root61]